MHFDDLYYIHRSAQVFGKRSLKHARFWINCFIRKTYTLSCPLYRYLFSLYLRLLSAFIFRTKWRVRCSYPSSAWPRFWNSLSTCSFLPRASKPLLLDRRWLLSGHRLLRGNLPHHSQHHQLYSIPYSLILLTIGATIANNLGKFSLLVWLWHSYRAPIQFWSAYHRLARPPSSECLPRHR